MNELTAAEILNKWSELLRRHSTHESSRLMEDWLKYQGYKLLGVGMYGAAWATPSGNTIKVNFSMQGAKDGWWLWATQCHENPGNPWMPVVHSILRDGDWYVAHVERLSKYDDALKVLPYRDPDAKIPNDPAFHEMVDTLIELRMAYGNTWGQYNDKESYRNDMARSFDLHAGNWMWRGSSLQLVLNDPINSLQTSISKTAETLCMAMAA